MNSERLFGRDSELFLKSKIEVLVYVMAEDKQPIEINWLEATVCVDFIGEGYRKVVFINRHATYGHIRNRLKEYNITPILWRRREAYYHKGRRMPVEIYQICKDDDIVIPDSICPFRCIIYATTDSKYLNRDYLIILGIKD